MESLVLNGDCIIEMGKYPDNYFDAIVTDPPYGLGKEPNPNLVLKDWIEKGYHEIQGKGFMGKEWDAFVPQPNLWVEVFRILKPGGHVLAFYGTRTYDWGVMAMRFAGFEVRDCIQWLYGSGFPKSHNVGKATNDKKWEGWGSALKPANEPIVLARKPLEKGLSIAENVLKWGTGGINIDGTRIKGKKEWGSGHINFAQKHAERNSKAEFESFDRSQRENEGRFPANVILTHHPECKCKGEETSENWNCHPDCPIKILDEQSGISKSTGGRIGNKNGAYSGIGDSGYTTEYKKGDAGLGDTGGASRFFYVAKASKSERNKGLEGFEEKIMEGRDEGQDERNVAYKPRPTPMANVHPTVKPVKLMQYLVRLITPSNGIVLDPFCGSGTTGIACKLEKFSFVGIEQDAEYTKIAEARIKNTQIDNTLW